MNEDWPEVFSHKSTLWAIFLFKMNKEWENKLRFYKGDECSECNKSITIKNKSGKCRSCGMMGHKRNLGRIRSIGERMAISKSKLGSKNPMWAGNKVGYNALHRWVESRLPKPELCQKCNIRKAIDLANKGIYDRSLENWEYLCRKCHMTKDGRMSNLKQYAKKEEKPNLLQEIMC